MCILIYPRWSRHSTPSPHNAEGSALGQGEDGCPNGTRTFWKMPEVAIGRRLRGRRPCYGPLRTTRIICAPRGVVATKWYTPGCSGSTQRQPSIVRCVAMGTCLPVAS